MMPPIDRQISGILADGVGRPATVRRRGRKQAWSGLLGYYKDATTYALREGNTVLVVFSLGQIVPPIAALLDGMEITIVP